jgi:hypothetical protein
MLIEALLSITCLLLYRKTKLRSLISMSIAIWLTLIHKYFIFFVAIILASLVIEIGNLSPEKSR